MPTKPQLFPDASVFFSIIHEFDEWLVEMTPVEISDLLDRLWVLFDELIARHDVYKVFNAFSQISFLKIIHF
jgi:hypothetical protein